jgi:pimeloyl-ACP methyl ester carboxylesterase
MPAHRYAKPAFLVLVWTAVGMGQQVSFTPTVLDTHPTVAEFRDEISRADIVARAKIIKILRSRDGKLGDEDAIIQPIRVYKGAFDSAFPCVRLEFHQSLEYKPGARLPGVGEEVILPLDAVRPLAGAAPLAGEKFHYFAKFYDTVAADGTIGSIFGFPPEMQPYLTLPAFETLILDEVNRPRPKKVEFAAAEVLFSDDFNDGSLAGWTFLEGERGFWDVPPEKAPFNLWNDETWVGPNSVLRNKLPNGKENPPTRMERDPATGILRGVRNGLPIEIGVFDGRLRLRGGHYWLHLIAVAGDPEWTDYQLDVDLYNFNDPAFAGRGDLGQVNYLKFGPYGRLAVPNMPETKGEHSFVAVEFGNFANYDVSEMTFDGNAFQIRCKYPESPLVWRDHSVLLRETRILDYQAWPIPQEKKIHLTAVYFGRHVEGWIDGTKVVESEIPEDHPGAAAGRIGLWAFETWCEFDNVKVTRLVPAAGPAAATPVAHGEAPAPAAAGETSTPLVSVRAIATQLPCAARFFDVDGRPAFLLMPTASANLSVTPWVWYAPTFPQHPDPSHVWMFRQFLEKGIAIAGVDVGESYGSPRGRAIYSALWTALRRDHGLAERACLMPQSRGGLMLYNWAAENPQRVACIAGIYTVCDLRSYPGLPNACGAYGMDAATLSAHLAEHNPVDRLRPLAEAGVPILHVHGDSDTVVPIEKNSGEIARRYTALGGMMRLVVVPGKGHQVAPEFFESRELVDFVIAEALAVREGPAAKYRNILIKDFMQPLDLSRQAARALGGFMIHNPERLPGPEGFYRTHFSCALLPGAALGHGRWDCGDMTSRAIMAWIGLREMTGDRETGREVEEGQRRFLLSLINPQTGLIFVPELANTAAGTYTYHSWDQSRTLRALIRWIMAAPADREKITPLIQRMIQGLDDFSDIRGVDATWGPYACWSADEFDQDHKPVPHPFDRTGYPDIGEVIPDPAGSCIEPLAMYAMLTDDAKALDLAIRFTNGELGQHRSDTFDPSQKKFAGFSPDGSFAGHFHSKTTTLIGIAKLGRYLAEHGRREEAARYLRAVRKTYDWIFSPENPVRGSRIGWFRERPRSPDPEMCCTADMIELAEAMAACATLGDEFRDWAQLYDDVESMTVNTIARAQIRMTPEFEEFLASRYGADAPRQLETARRLDGAWGTGPLPNDMVWNNCIPVSGCCQYAGVRGLWSGWRSAMQYDQGRLRINTFLARRSPAAIMTTGMPAAGTAELTLCAEGDTEVLVRVPSWLKPQAMKLVAAGRAIDPTAALDATGHYIRVAKLPRGAHVAIEFPLENRAADELIGTTRYGLLWRGNYVVRMIPSARFLPLYP